MMNSLPPSPGPYKLFLRFRAGIRLAAPATSGAAASTTAATASVLVDSPALALDPLGGCFRHRLVLVALRRQRHLDRLVALVAVVRQQHVQTERRQRERDRERRRVG